VIKEKILIYKKNYNTGNTCYKNSYDPPWSSNECKILASKSVGIREVEVRCKKKEQKNITTDDSNARGCTSDVRHNLYISFEVLVFVKPGKGVATVTNTVKEDIEKLKEKKKKKKEKRTQ
jgi:hypothetical protein